MAQVKCMFCQTCTKLYYPSTYHTQCIAEEEEKLDNFDEGGNNCRSQEAKEKKVVQYRNEKIRIPRKHKHAVALRTCCNAKDSSFVYLYKGLWNMSQTNDNYEKNEELVRNASDKRTAWKNSALTAAASERDSLLTNSGDDRTSFDWRQDQKQTRDSNRSPGDPQLDNNSNLLRVPSPARRSGFYSTSPSTDEGIGTDDHVPEDSFGKSPPEKSISPKKEKNIKYESIKPYPYDVRNGEERLIQNRSPPYASSPALFKKSHQTLLHGRQNPVLSNRRKPASFQDEMLCVQCYRNEENYRHPSSHPKRPVSFDSPSVQNMAYSNQQVPNRNIAIRRQSSDQQSNRSPRRLRAKYRDRNSWTSVASCCELGQGESQLQEGPVLIYSRLPGETHSCEARLPALIERRESEVVAKNGIMISRVISKSVDETNPSNIMNNNRLSSRASHKPDLDHNSNKTTSNTPVRRSASPTTGKEVEDNDTDSNKNGFVEQKSTSNPILKQSSVTSESTLPGSKKKFRKESNASGKTKSRTGSTRSSIGKALSTSVVATATGGVVPDQKPATPKEKQRRLTERLMSVGPSDPRRVQGIFEDILCEMGPKRIEQYKSAFAKFDKDSSGIISSKQLRTLLRTLGHNPSDTELRELVNQVDMDENGKIDFNEFIIMIGYFDKANNENEDLINIFRVYDRDEKGCIDVKELRNIWNNFLINDIPHSMFEEMLNVVDNDGNGEINRVELLELLSTR